VTHSFDIRFEPVHVDQVTFAVAPFDAFTGRVISEGVKASVLGLPDRPIRNRSGLLVFVNLPDQPQYDFTVRGSAAGYFDPPQQSFIPPAANDPNRFKLRRRSVALMPLPDSHFPEAVTVVRGVVVRGAQPVSDASIALDSLSAAGTGFATKTTTSGAFALPLRMPALSPGQNEAPKPITLHVAEGADQRTLTRSVRAGSVYRFDAPINLSDAAEPNLVEI